MKIDKKIDRRRFLKEGVLWGCLASLYPLVKLVRREEMKPEPGPRKARHWRRLAG